MREIPLSRGLVAIVDDDDYDEVSQFKWCARPDKFTFYASRDLLRREIPVGRGSQTLHKFLTGWPITDHRDGNGLNNMRSNLRVATPSQNAANTRKSSSKTSRFKGVLWYPTRRKWRAKIYLVGHKSIHLGSFADEIEAAKAYDAAAREVFGEFACVNFPLPGERGAL